MYVLSKDGARRFKLDNYSLTRGEIVFRRRTQFAEITVKSAMGYLREFVRKYSPGTIIARVQTNKALAGKRLEGRMIFEVPVQHKPIPKRIVEEATKCDIIIRDVNGKAYN